MGIVCTFCGHTGHSAQCATSGCLCTPDGPYAALSPLGSTTGGACNFCGHTAHQNTCGNLSTVGAKQKCPCNPKKQGNR